MKDLKCALMALRLTFRSMQTVGLGDDSRCSILSFEGSSNVSSSNISFENYPLHLGYAAAATGDELVMTSIVDTVLTANIPLASDLDGAAPQIPGSTYGPTCELSHPHLPHATAQSARPSHHEFYFLSVTHDAGFLPTSAASDADAVLPSYPAVPLDPFYADWPHWDVAAAHPPYPPRSDR
jgi:hypothetical protein